MHASYNNRHPTWNQSRTGSAPRPTGSIQVLTNHFRVTSLPSASYQHFQVEMKPEQENMRKRILLMHKLQTEEAIEDFDPPGIYDGAKSLYLLSSSRIGNKHYTVSLSDNPDSTRGMVRITMTRTTALITPLHIASLTRNTGSAMTNENKMALNLLQLIIRQHTDKMFPHNKTAYFSESESVDIGGGVQMLRGFYQSIRPTVEKLLINVDLTAAAFYRKGSVAEVALDYLSALDPRRRWQYRDLVFKDDSDPIFRALSKFLRHLRIRVQDRRGVFVIRGLVPSAETYRFKDNLDKTWSVVTYFKHLHESLNRPRRTFPQYPNVFGVRVTPRDAPRQVVYLAEMCRVEDNIFYKRTLTEEQIDKARKFSKQTPQDRLRYITKGASRSFPAPVTQFSNSEIMVRSGMSVSSELQTVSGRMLEPPRIEYANEQTVRPSDGKWNVVDRRLLDAAVVKRWVVVILTGAGQVRTDYYEYFLQCFTDCSHKLGLNLPTLHPDDIYTSDGYRVVETLDTVGRTLFPPGSKYKRNECFILVFLPRYAKEVKQKIKFWGDVQHGCVTQCLRQGKFNPDRKGEALRKALDQYCNNVLLKINARLGGVNSRPRSSVASAVASEPIMIMGADVGHAGASELRPSIASVVWSRDQNLSKYSSTLQVQTPRAENISRFQEMVQTAIAKFIKTNSTSPQQLCVPRRIFFYRDGIADSQQNNIALPEIAAIRAAIADIWGDSTGMSSLRKNMPRLTVPKPKLTYIVVGKRHHVVFFPRDHSQGDNTGNLRAGFVTDDDGGLESPFVPDFFLQSHSVVGAGTARSSHYTIYLDENFENDTTKVKELSFHLCHVYANATRSISIPAPVYYADLACTHAMLNAYDLTSDALAISDSASDTSSPDQRQAQIDAWKEAYHEPNAHISSSMFFM